jgi:tetratricopeptide (TPR) repeat protein
MDSSQSSPAPTVELHTPLTTKATDPPVAAESLATQNTATLRKAVGPFQLETLLGRGGMGVVYQARDTSGRAVAVKVLNPGVSADIIERFLRESRIDVQHPNVVRLVGAGRDPDGTLYIAFELLEGESLSTRLRHRFLDYREILDVGTQVLRGLVAAHAVGIVHRDLKPANLFCCKDGTIKILDFGVAHIQAETLDLTSSGVILGTPSYLAPEQVRAQGEIDAQADLWSLGIVLYEAIAGRSPFRRETALATMFAIVAEELAPPEGQKGGVPVDLSGAIMRALRKSKSERWTDAQTFLSAMEAVDLERLIEVTPTPSRRDTDRAEERVVAVLLAEGIEDGRMLRKSVSDLGGRYIRLIGGRAIGLFGGETWEGDEVKRAGEAALLCRQAAARVALASGRALVSERGIAGSALKCAEAAVASEVGGVVVDKQTANLLGASAHMRSISRSFFELLEIRREAKDDSETIRKPRILFGRDVELAQVAAAIQGVIKEGTARAMLIEGPPGIGKSCLRDEAERLFVDLAGTTEETAFVLVGRAESHRKVSALSLLASALLTFAKDRSALGAKLDPNAPLEERRRAVEQLVEDAFDDPDAAMECAPFLGELLGVRMPDSVALKAARGDPRLMSDRLRLAISDYLAALSQRGAIALMLEDLQWSDRESLECVKELWERLSSERFLLLMTARSEVMEASSAAFSEMGLVDVKLRGISTGEVGKLASMIAARPISEALIKAIADHTSGNPLFVEQIVLTLREKNELEQQVRDLPLPISVEAAIQSRLDHLTIGEKELCKKASVLGRTFSAQDVEALGARDVEPLIKSLRRRDLLSSSSSARSREKEYRFQSPMIASVAYRLLTQEDRASLHLKAAEHGVRVHAPADEVALHFERAGEDERASIWYARAALAAKRRGDMSSVLRCSEKALNGGLARRVELTMYMIRADAHQFLGNSDAMGLELTIASAKARTQQEEAAATAERSWWNLRTGRVSEALSLAEHAVSMARQANDEVVLVRSLGRWVSAMTAAGKLQDAAVALQEARAIAERKHSVALRALTASLRAHLATAMGDYGARREAFRTAASLYKQAGDLRRAAGAEANLADVYNRLGAYPEAEAALGEALKAVRRIGHSLIEGYIHMNLGYALIELGRSSEALEALASAERIASESREARLAIFVRVYRARALLLIDRAAEAKDIAREAANEAERGGHPMLRVLAFTAAARASLVLGDAEEAARFARDALFLRDELGGVEENEAEIYVTYADALAASGRSSEAEEILAAGHARLVDVVAGIADAEWRERFVRAVPANRRLMSASKPVSSSRG